MTMNIKKCKTKKKKKINLDCDRINITIGKIISVGIIDSLICPCYEIFRKEEEMYSIYWLRIKCNRNIKYERIEILTVLLN